MRWLKDLWKWIRKWWRRNRPASISNFILELDMTDIRGTWTLPTVRENGRALDRAEIQHTIIEVSLDGGTNWTQLAVVAPADPQEVFVPDADVGDWSFQATVVDTGDRRGTQLAGVITVPQSPPGPITDLTLVLE